MQGPGSPVSRSLGAVACRLDWRERYCDYKAGEFLVAADLSLAGYMCSIAAEGLSYDLLADDGHDVFTVQVKSTALVIPARAAGDTSRYEFSVVRCKGSKGKEKEDRLLKSYAQNIHVFAFVSLDRRAIVYRSGTMITRNVRIRAAKFTDENRDISRKEAFRAQGLG